MINAVNAGKHLLRGINFYFIIPRYRNLKQRVLQRMFFAVSIFPDKKCYIGKSCKSGKKQRHKKQANAESLQSIDKV